MNQEPLEKPRRIYADKLRTECFWHGRLVLQDTGKIPYRLNNLCFMQGCLGSWGGIPFKHTREY